MHQGSEILLVSKAMSEEVLERFWVHSCFVVGFDWVKLAVGWDIGVGDEHISKMVVVDGMIP